MALVVVVVMVVVVMAVVVMAAVVMAAVEERSWEEEDSPLSTSEGVGVVASGTWWRRWRGEMRPAFRRESIWICSLSQEARYENPNVAPAHKVPLP
ncbi:hypothetical protein V8C26DRAFT_386938 [Trichoderma gracile]